jgi:hypothetical protein
MIVYTDSLNLNAPKTKPNQITKKSNVKDITKTRSDAPYHSCPYYEPHINTQKAEPKSGVELILHEEKCMIELQRIIEHFNRHMFSSFRVDLVIP